MTCGRGTMREEPKEVTRGVIDDVAAKKDFDLDVF